MRRIRAAWALRTAERDHVASLLMVATLIALTVVGAILTDSGGRGAYVWPIAGGICAMWVGAYVHGLWAEGRGLERD